jgi:hypothetical protein
MADAVADRRIGLDRLLRQLKSNDWVSRALDGIGVQPEDAWVPPKLEINPSGTGGPCALDIQFGMLGHRTPIAPKNRRRMDNGTMAHRRWSEYFEQTNLLVVASKRLKQAGVWSGEIDVIVKSPATGSFHVGEIKTTNSNSFGRLPRQVADLDAMALAMAGHNKAYLFQLAQYVVKFKQAYSALSDEAFFLFENTDDQDYRVLWLRIGANLKRDAFLNGELARQATIDGRVIERPFAKGSSTCKRCYRRKVCDDYHAGIGDVVQRVEEAMFKAGQLPPPSTVWTEGFDRDQSDEFDEEIAW